LGYFYCFDYSSIDLFILVESNNSMNSSQLVNFPVQLTCKISNMSEIKPMIDEFIDHYKKFQSGEFSWRILLPRHSQSDHDIKRLGAAIYGELMLSLKKNKLIANLRDLRYIHDDDNYGWLLLNPKMAEKLETNY
jgi:hypothetical protein